MALQSVLEWVNTAAGWLGIPAIVTWFLYDRRRLRAQGRVEDVGADVVERTALDRVKTSSIVTLEAELVAARKSFDADRAIKDNTIQYLTKTVEEQRMEIDRKDEVIDRLMQQVRLLKDELVGVNDRINAVQPELSALQRHA